jgi:hypothetical protein
LAVLFRRAIDKGVRAGPASCCQEGCEQHQRGGQAKRACCGHASSPSKSEASSLDQRPGGPLVGRCQRRDKRQNGQLLRIYSRHKPSIS